MDIKEQLFVAKQQYIGLMTRQNTVSAEAKVSFQAIVDVACFPTLLTSKNTLQKINQSLLLRQSYQKVLAQLARYQSPALAAASSEDKVLHRAGKGFELRVSVDPSQTDQAFVMLKLKQANALVNDHYLDLHIALNEHFYHVHFSQPYNTSLQTILSTTSPEFLAIVDADAHLYLIE